MSTASLSVCHAQTLASFELATLAPALDLDGAGSNVDSIAFWEAPDPTETRMFVTGKNNDLVEVWQFPFAGTELPAIEFPANVNGVAVDQETDLLYITDRIVSVFSTPGLVAQGTFGQGTIGVGENNLDILKHANGQTWIYVSDDHNVYRFDAATSALLGSFAPPVSSIETVLTDDLYQIVYVAEEQGPEGNPGVYAYHPDGTPFEQGGTNRFGNNGEFDSDEEGMLLYTFPAHGTSDDGTGFIVVSDQRSDVTDFEFFDRQTWAHLGTLRLTGVSNTDGIASIQRPMPGYPLGVFAAIDDDTSTALVGWDAVFAAIGWDLPPEAVSITPTTASPTDAGSIEFAVEFSEEVAGFDGVDDLVISHAGTSSTGAVITGSGSSFVVTISGISGVGFITLSVAMGGGVVDLASNPISSSVTSAPIAVGVAYHTWADANGLDPFADGHITEDPDADGLTNLQEFATDDSPVSGARSGKTRNSVENIGGANYFTTTLPIRDGATFTGDGPISATVDRVSYSVAGSRDLSAYDRGIDELHPALASGLPLLSDGWSYHTFRLSDPLTQSPRGFVRLMLAPQ